MLPWPISFGAQWGTRWGEHVPHKATRSTKLPGSQHSPELALRSTEFCAPENQIFPALNTTFSVIEEAKKTVLDFSQGTAKVL